VTPAGLDESVAAVRNVESGAVLDAIDREGFWIGPSLVDIRTCARLANMYDGDQKLFR
jgi:hypothetical protein